MARSCVFPKSMKILEKMKSKETNVTGHLAPLSLLEVFRRIKDGRERVWTEDTNGEIVWD